MSTNVPSDPARIIIGIEYRLDLGYAAHCCRLARIAILCSFLDLILCVASLVLCISCDVEDGEPCHPADIIIGRPSFLLMTLFSVFFFYLKFRMYKLLFISTDEKTFRPLNCARMVSLNPSTLLADENLAPLRQYAMLTQLQIGPLLRIALIDIGAHLVLGLFAMIVPVAISLVPHWLPISFLIVHLLEALYVYRQTKLFYYNAVVANFNRICKDRRVCEAYAKVRASRICATSLASNPDAVVDDKRRADLLAQSQANATVIAFCGPQTKTHNN